MSPAITLVVALGLVVATLISAFLSALETALFSLKEHHISTLAEKHPERQDVLLVIARKPRQSIEQVLFLTTVANLSLAILALFAIRDSPLVFHGRPILSGFVLLGSIVVLGDLIPKIIALAHPDRLLHFSLKPLLCLSPAIAPLSAMAGNFAEKIVTLLFPERIFPTTHFSDAEFETIVQMQEDDGLLKASESEIIRDIIRLGNKTVKDCMIPRTDALLIADDLDPAEALKLIREQETWHWGVPVYHGTPDVVVGILNVRSWLQALEPDFREFVNPPVFLPETMKALDAFQIHLSLPHQLAIVVDEYGGMEGILTNDELIEEILEEAAPSITAAEEILEETSGRIIASGDARLDDLSDQLGLNIEQEGLDTIGGLIFTFLGHLPEPGETAEIGELSVTVRKIKNQKIDEVTINLHQQERRKPRSGQ